MNQCIRLVEYLTEFSKTRPVNEIKQATHGIVFVLGNIRMVFLFYFSKDFIRALTQLQIIERQGFIFYNFWYPTGCLNRKKRKILYIWSNRKREWEYEWEILSRLIHNSVMGLDKEYDKEYDMK